MNPIAIFYHCALYTGNPAVYRSHGAEIIRSQMKAVRESELLDHCNHFAVGINGGKETLSHIDRDLPANSKRFLHGLRSKSENLTIVELERWLPGHSGWNVLYFHTKGLTRNDQLAIDWRVCMMARLVRCWRQCVADLEQGFDAVGCHWIRGLDATQHYFAGNFWWATSDFLLTLPSIYKRNRIRLSGIDSIESRYEAEVWIGNGPRLPKVKDYHPGKHW